MPVGSHSEKAIGEEQGSFIHRITHVLQSERGVEIRVIVQVVFDDVVALARPLFEPIRVNDANDTTVLFDEPLLFEIPGRYRNRRTGTSEHVR